MNLLSRLFGKTETSTEILCPHCERSMDAGHDVEACARKRVSRRYFFGVLGGAAAAVAAVKTPASFAPGTFTTANAPALLFRAQDIGLHMRVVHQYDQMARKTRIDVLYGFGLIAPTSEMTCRILS